MAKFLLIWLLFLSLFCANYSSFAQNCTINAGVDQNPCTGEPFTLVGTATGSFAETAVWTQIAGPAVTVSATTISLGQVTASVTGFSKGIPYTFRLSAKCTDGTPVYNDVVYTYSPLTVANAGPSITSCPGTITMAANAVQPGETGEWFVISGSLPLPSPVNSPTATVTLPEASNIGTTVYRWRITSAGTCVSQSDVSVTNIGGVTPVTASGPALVNCYTVTGTANISGSYPGSGNGQEGTWSFISGPSTPTFGNIHDNTTTLSNLTGGTYVVRWTVVGQCASGSADVTINVDPPSQNVTPAGGANLSYCDNRTSTVLNGVKPLYTNETVQWVSASGNPAGVVFSNPTSPTTTVSGLNGASNYTFIYTILNSVTNCSSSGNYNVNYITPPQFVTFPASPVVLPTDTLRYVVNFSVAGGNGTETQLVSAPAGSRLQDSIGLNTPISINGTSLEIRGMDVVGTYVFRFRRYSNNASGGCSDAFKDLSIIVSRSPYKSNAGTSQYLACGTTTATLAGNAPQPGDNGEGTWTQVSGPNTAIIVNKHSNATLITGLISGVYVFRWIISGGQNVLDNEQSEVQVIVASQPTVVSAGADIATCYGTPVKLNGNQPQNNETGTWSFVSESPSIPTSTITFSNVNDPQAIVNGLLPFRNYTFRWTISNACGSISDDVTVNTNAANGPQQAVAGDDQCLPSGTSSFTLSANAVGAGETGTWTLLPGSPNTPVYSSTASTQTVTGAINGTYNFEWRLSKGVCSDSRDTVAVTISAPTTAATIVGAPLQRVCGISPITLTGNAPAAGETGKWTQVGGIGGAVINSPNSNVTTVSNLTTGTYNFRWTISNNTCSSSYAEIAYDVSENPTTANAGPNQNVCDVTSTTLSANLSLVGTGTWSVISGPNMPVFANLNSPVSGLSGLILGTYVLRWTITNGTICPPSTSDVTISVGQSAKAGPDQNLCDASTTLLVGNEGSTGTWTQVSGPAVTLTQNSNNTYEVTGLVPGNSYVFRYTITSNACGTVSDDVTVNVSGSPSIADAGPDQNLCTSAGTSLSLTAVTPTVGSGVWTIESQPSGASATIASPNLPSTNVDNLTVSGAYLFKWTVSANNCAGNQSNNDITRIDVSLPPTVAQPMPAQTANCTSSVILTGTTPVIGIGTWTNVSGPNTPTIDAPNSPTTTVSNLVASATPYIFRWTITNGSCAPSSQDVSVGVSDNAPAVAAAGTVSDKCTNAIGGNATAVLASTNTLSGNDVGTWTVVTKPAGSPTVVFSDIHSPTATISSLVAGPYTLRWTITNTSSCTSSSDVSFTVFDPPSTADAGASSADYCLYSQVILSATAPTSGTGTWSVISKPAGAADPVFSSVNANNASVTGLVQGVYVFRWTTSNGPCATSQDDITVNVNDCQIAVSKDEPTTPLPQADGSFNVTFVFHVKNTGTISVNNIQVLDDLTLTFPSPKTFSTVSVVATGGLAANTGFNGNADKNLLNAASSSLASGVEQTVTLVVNVKLN